MFCTDIGNDLGLDKDGYMDSMRKLNAPHGRITLHCDVINLIARAHNENWRAGHLWMNGVKAMNHKIAMVVYVPNYKTVSESWITLNGQPLHKSSMKKRLVIKPPVSLQDVVGVAGAYSVLHRDPDKVPKNYRQFMITGATGNLLTVRHIQEKLSRIFYVGEEAFSFFSDWRIHVERSAKQHQREESIRQTIREEAHRETIAGPDFRHSFGGQVGDRDHQIGGKRQTYGGSGNVFNINTDTARPMQDLATNQDADLPSTPAPPPTSPSAAVFKGLTLYRYDHKGKVLPMHDTGVELDISEESLALWKEGNDIKPFCRIPLGSIQRCQFKDGKTHVRLDFIVTLVLDGVAKDEVNRISVSAGDAGRAANLKGAIEKAMENYRTSIPSPISSIGGPPSPISPLASGSDVERSTATDAALTRYAFFVSRQCMYSFLPGFFLIPNICSLTEIQVQSAIWQP